jgi:hypothetical protein
MRNKYGWMREKKIIKNEKKDKIIKLLLFFFDCEIKFFISIFIYI